MFRTRYGAVFEGDEYWGEVPVAEGETFSWQDDSTYVKNPPFFEGMTMTPTPVANIEGAHVLAMVGDSVTTDHISPAGSIGPDTPAGRYLAEHGVPRNDFNSYGARRGNHEVMMRAARSPTSGSGIVWLPGPRVGTPSICPRGTRRRFTKRRCSTPTRACP